MRNPFNRWRHSIEERLENLEGEAVNDAEKLAAVEASVSTVEADLTASQTALQAEIDALKAGNPALDFSKLEAEVAGLDTHAKAIGGLVPAA